MSYSDHCKLGKHDAFVMRLKLDEGLECDRFEYDDNTAVGSRTMYVLEDDYDRLDSHLNTIHYRLINKGKCVICRHRRDPDVI